MSELLQAEVERLQAEVESYRQRELQSLKDQLAAARQECLNMEAIANNNARAARKIAAEADVRIASLETRVRELTSNGR